MSQHDSHSPLDQFIIHPLIKLEVLGIDISITNSSASMIFVTISLMAILLFAQKNIAAVPNKIHVVQESIYMFIYKMAKESLGEHHGKAFVPLLLSLFLFIGFANLLGIIPYSFTLTSHFSASIVPALIVFFTLVISGFIYQGVSFLRIFAPSGVPLWLMPLISLIEICTFFARPFSLSLRLAANMTAGHVFLKVLAGFMVSLPWFAKIIPIPLIVLLIGFEVFVSILQAYLFVVLSCVYLSDAVKGH